jgi:hypothetical protein
MWFIYTIEFYSAIRNNGMWLETRLRKTKAACFLSDVEDRSKRHTYTQQQT